MVERAHQVLVAAHQHATALLDQAHAANARRLAEAQALALQIREAANAAAERVLAAAAANNEEHLRLVAQQRHEVLMFAEMQVADVVGRTSPGGLAAARTLPTPPVNVPDGHVSRTVEMAPTAVPQPPMALSDGPAPVPFPATNTAAVPEAANPGSVEIVVGPFHQLSQLARFSRALRTLRGVGSVETRQFFNGRVHLRLRYDDPVPLATRIHDLSDFSLDVVNETPRRIEMRVRSKEPLELSAAA